MTPREFALLYALAAAPGAALSTEELYLRAWNAPMVGSSQALRSSMSRLRKKLDCFDVKITYAKPAGYTLTAPLT
ncbi:MAG: helix-turn-helix domain-containing protein [Bifidobacteriaceae bacterium]|nr:helix-turn-helix domain-containing protein [Bifidobacteriaceae bacterium]